MLKLRVLCVLTAVSILSIMPKPNRVLKINYVLWTVRIPNL